MSDPVIVIVDDDDSVFIEEIDDEIEVYEVAYIGGGAEIDAAVAAAVAAQAAAEAAAEDIAAASAQIDANTAAITANSDAITAANTTIAFEQAAVAVRRGPSVGVAMDSFTPIRDAYLDASGKILSFVAPDRSAYRIDRHGLFAQTDAQLETKGPSLGWIGSTDAGPAKRAGLDAGGRLTDGEGRGWGHQGSRFTATPKGVAAERVDRAPEIVTLTGTTIAIPESRIDLVAGPLDTITALVSMPAPATEAVTAEAFTMAYQGNAVLAYQYLSGTIVVTKTAGSVVLTEGTDYSLDRDRGWVYGLVNTASFACTIAYTGNKQRADLIVADVNDGTITRIAGTERKRAAAMQEATITGNKRALYRAFRWRDGTDLVPVHRYRGNRLRNAEGSYGAKVQANQQFLRRFIAKLNRGQDVRLGLYGDSISAMGGLDASMNTSANGLYRDRVSFFQDYDTATRALIPTYDYGDGLGQIHTREGLGWKTAQFIQDKYLIEVDYQNGGIGGTWSANSTFLNGAITVYNGSYPPRLNAFADLHCDLVIIAFGMNELGFTDTCANLVTIVNTLKANGSDVLLVTPVRRSVIPTTQFIAAYDYWRYTCGEIERAADLTGVACVNSYFAFGRENLGALGMAERELCDQSLLNHPGLKELNGWASLVTDLF